MTGNVNPPGTTTPSLRVRSRTSTVRKSVAVGLALSLGLAMLGALAGLLAAGGSATAEARVVVGAQDLNAQSVPYYSTATVGLAETYARYVTEDAGEDLPESVTVSASVVAETPVIRIQAAAPSEAAAVAAAQRVTDDLLEVVNEGVATRSADLAADIEEVNRRLLSLRTQAETLQGEEATDETINVDTEVRLAELELSALSTAYEEAYAAQINPATGLTQVESAHLVYENVPRPVLTGAVAGAVIGALLTLAWFAQRHGASVGGRRPLVSASPAE